METSTKGARSQHRGLSSALWSGSLRSAGRGIAAILIAALLLAACGGGGGNRSTPPPGPSPDPSGPPPPAPPPPPGPPPVVETPNPGYSQHLAWTGADEAHADGLTGAGFVIGIIDSGVNRNHPALRGRVTGNFAYINPNTNNMSVDDVVGHGTAVAQVAAGSAFGQWPGGIAPGARIVSARIISDEPPTDDGSGRGNEISGALGLEPIHRDLIQRGMRIMNNSWGGLYWTNPNATDAIAAEYRDFIHNRDGLVVFSTGNSGFDNPSDNAALPSQRGPGNSRPAADLERGWLAVAALDEYDRRQLADYSNACGLAMDYCLAAPGSVTTTGTDDPPNAPDYWLWHGTSFSAPVVSGAAALVWEAFPYFDNDLVRQTLLGTATDLGAPGVDPVFGHGALNIARAVKGPSRLDWGDMWVGFDGGTSVWGNDLSGDGALIKDGNGTLVLEGRLRNRDGLFVDAGTVQALQTIDGDVDVASAGQLVLGNGTRGGNIGGTLDNAGRIEVLAYGTSTNITRIGGDYLHHNTATLGLELGQRFSVQGAAVIEGGAFHLLGIKPGYTYSTREEVMFANAGVRGEFSNLTSANSLFLDGRLSYAQNRVWLDITRLNVTTAAMQLADVTPMALSGAARVEQAFTALDAETAQGQASNDGTFWQAAGQLQQLNDPSTALAALDSLSGQAHARAITLAFDNIELGRRAIASRLAAWEANPAQSGVWTQLLGSGGAAGMVGGGWTQNGWMIGQDRAFDAQTVMGFAFGESEAQASLSRERSHARQTQAQLYLGRTGSHGYLAAQLGFGRSQRNILRHPFAGDGWQGVSSQSNARYGSLALEAGSRLALGAAALTPYLGVEHSWLDNDPFQEWGGAGFGLRADAASMQRTQAIVGLRVEGTWHGLEIGGHAGWQQVLAADGFDVMASFTGIDSWSPLPMADAARSGGVFGLGVKAQISPKARLSANLDQRFGPRGNERIAMLRYVCGF